MSITAKFQRLHNNVVLQKREKNLRLEQLEQRHMLAADPVISEFMASNGNTLPDGDGNSSDWIEIYNAGDTVIDLQGWFLTDDNTDLNQWPFPSVVVEPASYLVVFASGQLTDNFVDGGGNLHTNFKLSAGGEYLALVDGTTVKQEFAPTFPSQVEDVSFGLEMETTQLVGPLTPLEYLIPTDDTLEPAWRNSGFTDPALVDSTPAESSDLVITEANTGATDFVEIQNVSGQTVNTDGWVVAVNSSAVPTGVLQHIVVVDDDVEGNGDNSAIEGSISTAWAGWGGNGAPGDNYFNGLLDPAKDDDIGVGGAADQLPLEALDGMVPFANNGATVSVTYGGIAQVGTYTVTMQVGNWSNLAFPTDMAATFVGLTPTSTGTNAAPASGDDEIWTYVFDVTETEFGLPLTLEIVVGAVPGNMAIDHVHIEADVEVVATDYDTLISNDPNLLAYWRLGEVEPGAPVVVGQDLIDRPLTDGAQGTAVYSTPIPNGIAGMGQVTTWEFFNNNAAAAGLMITPLLLEDIGTDQYVVRGVGTTRTVTDAGLQQWDFEVADGVDTYDWTTGDFHLGMRFGTTNTLNTGVVDLDIPSLANPANTWDFITVADNLVADAQLSAPQHNNLSRDYSIQFNVVLLGGGASDVAVDETGNHDGNYSAADLAFNQTGALINDTNTAVDFIGGEVNVPTAVALDSGGSTLTVEAWVQLDSLGAAQTILSKDGATPGVDLDYLLSVTPTGEFQFITQNTNSVQSSLQAQADGTTWYHVVGVQDSNTNTLSLYINGLLQGTAALTNTGVLSPNDLKIGSRNANGGEPLDGRLDEVALYDRAFSLTDVQDHFLTGQVELDISVNGVNPFLWHLPASMSAGELQYRTDDSGDNFIGSDIKWNTDGNGWVMIVDDLGAVVDFVAWGYTDQEIATMDVNINGFDISLGDQWTAAGAAASGTETDSLQRQGDTDQNDLSNFLWQTSSKGVTNTGLTVPFQASPTNPLLGPIGYGQGGDIETIGPDVIDRAITDTASGSLFLLDNLPFTEAGPVTSWSMFSTNTLTITPVIFKLEAGAYEIAGIGQTRVSDGSGEQTFDFNLQSGSAMVEAPAGGTTYLFGFKDGDTNIDNTGVIEWDDNTADTIRWFGGGQAINLVAGNGTTGNGQTFSRTYSVQATVESIASNVNTNIQAEMLNQATSVYVRYPFDVTDASSINTLALRMRYDDGFIAYLNGTEIQRQNVAPVAAYNSLSIVDRPLSELANVVEFNISQHVGLLTNGENVLAIHGFNDAIDSSEFLIDAQLVSVNIASPLSTGFFDDPTPGASNSETFAGFVGDTAFDFDRGFYTTQFDLTITTPQTPDADIYYTTDGTEPIASNSSATLYSVPITIDQTTTVRAAGYKVDLVPTNIDTHTYIFVSDVVNQSTLSNHITGDAIWGPQVDDALLALPTISIVTNTNTFETGGIVNTEVGVSLEMIFPDGTTGFQIDAGAEHFGGHSLAAYPKKSMRLSFKNIYGDPRLRYDVFGDGGVDNFDQILLRSASHDSMFYNNASVSTSQGVYVRGRWAFERQAEMGQPAPRGRFVNLYLNGTYWGQFNLMERPNAAFMAETVGGDKEDYDALNAGSPVDGDIAAWNTMASVAANGTYADLQQYLDVENYADYMLLQFYGGNDWDWNHSQNWMAARERTPGAGYVFFAWDSDMMVRRSVNANVINRGGPGNLWSSISSHPEFVEMMADRAQKYFFNDGMLTPARVTSDFLALKSEIDTSIIAETARWGDKGAIVPNYDPNDWNAEFNQLLDDYVNASPNTRTDIVIAQMRAANIFPSIDAPSYAINNVPQHGGVVDAGVFLSMDDGGTGVIFFTTDGSIPDFTSSSFTSPFALSESVTVKSRTWDGLEWSATSEALFTVNVPLRVTEIMYNPEVSDSTEFIELVNTSAVSISLEGVRFDGSVEGIEFTFSDMETDINGLLGPGDHVVVVRNQTAFAALYNSPGSNFPTSGMRIAIGQYDDSGTKLSNDGEKITLLDAAGGLIQEFTYNDTWYKETDNNGFSLVVEDTAGDYNDPTNWRSSALADGSPGADDPDALAADFNGDGVVNAGDLAILLANYGTVSGANRAEGNANPTIDSAVNLQDLLLVKKSFGDTVSSSPPAAAAAALTVTVGDIKVTNSVSQVVAVDQVLTKAFDELIIEQQTEQQTDAISIRKTKSQRYTDSVDQTHAETLSTTRDRTRTNLLHRARRGHRPERLQTKLNFEI